MVEHSAMCEKILRKLEYILSTDLGIEEFAVVPTPQNEANKSPVLCEENCIGLESWCEKYLLLYTHSVLLKNRKKLFENQLPLENMRNLDHLLIGALLIQPNVTTFWNMKRELVKREILNVEHELYFSKVALSRHSKSNDIFSYRKWLINLLPNKDFFELELSVCETAAEKSKNNYHAWNHRIWCLEQFVNNDDLLLSELNFSINWIMRHVSEYTGYHYRQVLITKFVNFNRDKLINTIDFKQVFNYLKIQHLSDDPFEILHSLLGKSNSFPILENSSNCINTLCILLSDLTFFSTEFKFYSDHECLWNYRRYLVVFIMKILYNFHSVPFKYQLLVENIARFSTNILNVNVNSSIKNEVSRKITSSDLYTFIIKNEIDFIDSNKNSSNSLQKNLALRHLKWLKCTCFYVEKN